MFDIYVQQAILEYTHHYSGKWKFDALEAFFTQVRCVRATATEDPACGERVAPHPRCYFRSPGGR